MEKIKKNFLRMNLQHFAEQVPDEDKGDGGEQTPAGAQSTDTSESPKVEDKTIPYDRFKQVNDDLKTFKETFKELGLESVDSLKTLVGDYQQRKQAEEERKREEMSEIERLQSDLQAKQEVEQSLQQQLDDYKTQVEQEKIRNAFITKAQQANIAYIDDALALADLSEVKVGEEGVSGVDEVIASLVEGKPFLLGQQTKEPKTIGEATNQGAGNEVKTLESQLEEAKKNKDFSKVIEISNLIKQKLSK